MDNKRVLQILIAFFLVLFLVSTYFFLEQGEVADPCDRLDPCCYGQGDPFYLYHKRTDYRWWEFVNEAEVSLYQFWQYENDTWLFFDNTTGHTISTTNPDSDYAHSYIIFYAEKGRDNGDVSQDGYCWVDRVIHKDR
ncbi:MAG: hypothetical protein ACXADO_00665 [Candidatus Thorarchaeota archaeon]